MLREIGLLKVYSGNCFLGMRKSACRISFNVLTEGRSAASWERMSGEGGRVSRNRGVDGVARPGDADRDNGSKCFVSRPNPVTGNTEWVMQAANYDYHQEIARYVDGGTLLISG